MIALAASSPAVAADQFDLICAGTQRTLFGVTDKQEPYSERFRIDLKTQQWCRADCGAVRKIAEVQQAYLRLEPSSNELTADGQKRFDQVISRTDGRLLTVYMVNGRNFFSMTTAATCKSAPFSGFPELHKEF
jgi:hypothetical protein